MSTAFLIWAVQRAARHAGDYLTGEVRLCLERTLDLLRSGADAQEEWHRQERLFLMNGLPAGTDGMVLGALEVSWGALVRACRAPRSTALEHNLAGLAQIATLRQLQAEVRARPDLTPSAAEKALSARRSQIAQRAREAFHEELALIERMKTDALAPK